MVIEPKLGDNVKALDLYKSIYVCSKLFEFHRLPVFKQSYFTSGNKCETLKPNKLTITCKGVDSMNIAVIVLYNG